MFSNQISKFLNSFLCKLFLNMNTAFLAPILDALQVKEDTSVNIAATDGSSIFINKDKWDKFSQTDREFIFLHEVWHVALLHNLRRGDRDHYVWNVACDYVINNNLYSQGFIFSEPEKICLDSKYTGMTEEEIYDLLLNQDKVENAFDGDILENTDEVAKASQKALVSSAIASAKAAGVSSSEFFQRIEACLKPVVDWKKLLRQYFTDIFQEDFSWRKRNKRYQDYYLPSRVDMEEGKLTSLEYYIDVSGSISLDDLKRVVTELVAIKRTINPGKMTIYYFDTSILKKEVILEHQSYTAIESLTGGGTDLSVPLLNIKETKPTAAIIFSDLCDSSQNFINPGIPIFWVTVKNTGYNPGFGKRIITG